MIDLLPERHEVVDCGDGRHQHRKVNRGNSDPFDRNYQQAEFPLVSAMRQHGRNNADNLHHRFELAQFAGLIVKPSLDAMERSPEIRNSRAMMTTTIHTLTTWGLYATSAINAPVTMILSAIAPCSRGVISRKPSSRPSRLRKNVACLHANGRILRGQGCELSLI